MSTPGRGGALLQRLGGGGGGPSLMAQIAGAAAAATAAAAAAAAPRPLPPRAVPDEAPEDSVLDDEDEDAQEEAAAAAASRIVEGARKRVRDLESLEQQQQQQPSAVRARVSVAVPPVGWTPLAKAAGATRSLEYDAQGEVRAHAAHRPQDQPRAWAREPYASRCFLCEYGNRTFDQGDRGCRPYVWILRCIKENYGYMDNYSLALMVANYYHFHLERPSHEAAAAASEDGDGQAPLPPMPPALVQEHIEMHTLNPIVIAGESIRTVRDVVLVLRNRIVDEQNNVDTKNVDALSKMVALLVKLMQLPKTKMLFAGGAAESLVIDPNALGNDGNLRRVAPLLARGGDTIGGATAAGNAAGGAPPVETTQPTFGVGTGGLRRGPPAGATMHDVVDGMDEAALDALLATIPF